MSHIQRELENQRVAAVSGPYDYGFDSFMRSADHLYTGYVFSHIDSWLYTIFRKKAGVIMGGNFGVWKKALVATGGVTPLPFGGEDAAIAMMLSRKAGKVVFDPTLVVKSSPRRFEREGFVRTIAWYMFSFFRAYFMDNFPKYQEIEQNLPK